MDLLHCNVGLNKTFYFFSVKLIEYIFSAVKAPSNLCVEPLPSTNISLFLSSICIEVLISAPKINTFCHIHDLKMKNLILYQI